MARTDKLANRLAQEPFDTLQQEVSVGVLTVAGHITQRLNEVCGERGITHDQYNVLRILSGARPKGYARFEIARRLINRAPDVTRLLDRLERNDLVERHRSPHDRRQSISSITSQGMELLEAMDEEIQAVHRDAVANLTEQERWDLAHVLPKMIPEDQVS